MSVFITRTLLILFIGTVMTGCKFALMVTADGDVSSSSGTRDCYGGSICEFEITDTDFSETFTAAPRAGYVFSKWQAGDGYLCGNSTNPVCVVSNVPAAGIPVVDALILTGAYYYAKPTFTFVGIDTDDDGTADYLDEDDDNDGILDEDDVCPLDSDPSCAAITDTVLIIGKQWAQLDLFRNLSWNDINAVCPGGPCQDGGMLNGHDMSGWTWASVDEVHEIFNFYSGGDPVFGPGYTTFSESNTTWGPLIFEDGMRTTLEYASGLDGWVNNEYDLYEDNGLYAIGYYLYLSENNSPDYLWAGDNATRQANSRDYARGGWFYRIP